MYYFIVNPSAHSRKNRKIWIRVRNELNQRGILYRAFRTEYPGHAKRLAEAISRKDPHAVIAAVGGDGTVHEILSGLVNLDTVTFGLIPAGSGNDFARGMGIPSKQLPALAAILDPSRIVRMDVGRTDAGRFGVSCGIGLDAAVCHQALTSPVKGVLNALGLGSLTYALIAVKLFASYRPESLSILLNTGEELSFPRAYFAAAMNQRFEGGGFMMTPKARPDDGELSLIIAEEMPRLLLALAFPLAKFGLHTRVRGVHFVNCRSAVLTSGEPSCVHLDGDSGGIRRTLSVELESEKLQVITA